MERGRATRLSPVCFEQRRDRSRPRVEPVDPAQWLALDGVDIAAGTAFTALVGKRCEAFHKGLVSDLSGPVVRRHPLTNHPRIREHVPGGGC